MTTLMNAALPASAAHGPISADAPPLPAGLTDLDASRITAAIAASKSETTRTVYGHVWRQWERWCANRSIPALPADPLALCAYLTERAEAGKATSGIRDASIILLGYASAMRRAEIVALELPDVEHKPAGLLLNIRKSKLDQEGHGQQVAVAHGQHALTDPVAALNAWRTVRGETPGALFTRIWGSTVSLEPLSGHVVARMLRARAEAVGLDGTRITAHSLRAGHATAAALAGVPLDRIAAQTRHKDLTVLVNRYIRPLEALATTSSKELGLCVRPTSRARGCRPIIRHRGATRERGMSHRSDRGSIRTFSDHTHLRL